MILQQWRDEFVNEVFRSAGLPLLHVPAQASYSVAELRAAVTSARRRDPPPAASSGAAQPIRAAKAF